MSEFKIKSYTCSLTKAPQDKGGFEVRALLDGQTKYVIPPYQRAYSWKKDKVERFLKDIITTKEADEALFIGSMLLRENKDKENTKDVVDGQQRLTTCFILIKLLQLRYTNGQLPDLPDFEWLSTEVENGELQRQLEMFKALKESPTAGQAKGNIYIEHALYIHNEIGKIKSEVEGGSGDGGADEISQEYIQELTKHILSNLFFVVMETSEESFFKTLQIFDTLNTGGQRLDHSDVFKVRMYAYLKKEYDDGNDKVSYTDSKGKWDRNQAMEAISGIYKKIRKNSFTSATEILGIYKHIIVAKYNLPRGISTGVIHDHNVEWFWNELFDAMLNNAGTLKDEVKNIKLSIEEINTVIDMRVEEHNFSESELRGSLEHAFAICAFGLLTFYGRYHYFKWIFMYAFREEDDFWKKYRYFNVQLLKVFMAYSLHQGSIVGSGKNFARDLVETILSKSYDDVIDLIDNKIKELGSENKDLDRGRVRIKRILEGNIVYKKKWRDIACYLSAIFAETDTFTKQHSKEERDKILEKFLWPSEAKRKVHIEHIEPRNNKDGSKREQVWKEWGDDLHSPGNLMVLEENINKSVGNKPYVEKIKEHDDEKLSYARSQFKIVKKQGKDYPTWNREKCKDRKKKEVNKILDYLFNGEK